MQIYDRIQSLEAEVRELRTQSVAPASDTSTEQRGKDSTESAAVQGDSP